MTGRPAWQTTDRLGHQSIGGFFLTELTAHPLGEDAGTKVWGAEVGAPSLTTLGKLLSHPSFSLLARHLFEERKFDLKEEVRAYNGKHVRQLVLCNRVYRECRGLIYEQRKKV